MNPTRNLDSLLEQLLFIRPDPIQPDSNSVSTLTSRRDPSFRVPLLISATRCIIQYVILPFVLPFIGVIGGTPAWLGLTLNAAATISLVSSLRRVWQTRHPRRLTYLPLVILMLFVIAVFTISDL